MTDMEKGINQLSKELDSIIQKRMTQKEQTIYDMGVYHGYTRALQEVKATIDGLIDVEEEVSSDDLIDVEEGGE